MMADCDSTEWSFGGGHSGFLDQASDTLDNVQWRKDGPWVILKKNCYPPKAMRNTLLLPRPLGGEL